MKNLNTADPIQLKGGQSTGKKVLAFINKNNTFFVFIILFIISSLLTSNFFTVQNLTNLLRQNAPLGIAALGMLMVIFTGGIDLSIGAVLTLANIVFAYYLQAGYDLGIAFLITIAFAVICGTISGYLVAYHKLAPFVVTLALMSMAKGFAYILSNGASISIKHDAFLLFSKSYIIGVPMQFWIMIGFYVVMALIFRFAKYGRLVVAIGSNEEAVRLSGIRINRYKMSVYCICALFAAVGGVLLTGRMGVGSVIVGDGMEMDAIAGAVLGGASLSGGKGSIIKTIFGVYTLGVIGNIMNLMQVPAYPQQVIKGVIIIAAILLQKYSSGRKG
jgi:ribose transport system permease protein